MHIADVSHFIRPGNALDQEAASRGTTVYLCGKVLICGNVTYGMIMGCNNKEKCTEMKNIVPIRKFWICWTKSLEIKTNQHIRKISEGSCDTEDWKNNAENTALQSQE